MNSIDPELDQAVLLNSRLKLNQASFLFLQNRNPIPFTIKPVVVETPQLSEKEFYARQKQCRGEASTALFLAGPRSPVTPCLSLKKGMSAQQEKNFNDHIKSVQQEMAYRNVTAPFTAIGAFSRKTTEVVTHSFTELCNGNPVNRMVCDRVKSAASSLTNKIPDIIKKPLDLYHGFVEQKAVENFQKYRVVPQETRDFYSGALSVGSGVLTKTAFRLLKAPPRRITYKKGYWESRSCFLQPKEFKGILKKDLVLVRFHGKPSIHRPDSLQWFTSTYQANQLCTLEQIFEKLALLSKWGERSHVTVARIPAGEKVRFMYGRSARQLCEETLESVEGKGLQYRFYDFNPSWVVETKKIP